MYLRNLEGTLVIIGGKGTAVIGGVAVNNILIWRFEDGAERYNRMQ